MIKAQLAKDNELRSELVIAKELGMTLQHLQANMTLEEMLLWHAHFTLEKEEREKREKRGRIGGRR